MRQRGLLALLMVVGAVAIVAVYFWQAGKAGKTALSEGNFPQEVAGAKLQGLLSGEEAMRHISQLHGTEIEIENGYMAVYLDPKRQIKIVVWVSQSRDNQAAEQLFTVMDEKMPGNKVFTNYSRKEFAGLEYVYVSGAGMDNYYYVQGREVYWIGIAGGEPEQIFQEVVNTFKDFS